MVAIAGGVLSALIPYFPTIAKAALGFLSPNAQAVVGQIIETVKAGIGIASPILKTLENIQGADSAGKDITLAEMIAALSELKKPGSYEAALAAAKAAT